MPRTQARGGERMANFEYYKEDDLGFSSWLGKHPAGYVLNCYNTGKLHTASCPYLRVHGEKMTHTRHKACSTSVPELRKYAKRQGWEAPEYCQRCLGRP